MKLPFGENFHDAYDAIVGMKEKENKMMNVHDHSECLHEEIKFCAKCDLAYCKKCLREWGTCRMAHYYTWSPNWIFTTTTNPISITSTSSSSSTDILDLCNHA